MMGREELISILRLCNADIRFIEAISLAFDVVEKREWKTLDDDEYMIILTENADGGYLSFYNMVEKALKKKNHEDVQQMQDV
jgi:hypothetical protein